MGPRGSDVRSGKRTEHVGHADRFVAVEVAQAVEDLEQAALFVAEVVPMTASMPSRRRSFSSVVAFWSMAPCKAPITDLTAP